MADHRGVASTPRLLFEVTRFMRLTLRAKLLGMASVLLALTLLIGLVSIKNLASVDHRAESMYSHSVVPIRDLAEIRAILGDIDSQIQRAITDKGDDSGYVQTVAQDVEAVDAVMKHHEETFHAAAEKEGLRVYHELWTQYQRSFNAVLEHAQRGDDDDAVAEYYARSDDLHARVDGSVKELIAVNDVAAGGLNDEIAATYRQGRTIVIVLVLAGLVAGFLLAFALSRSISRGVAAVLARLRALASEDLTALDTGLEAMARGDLTVHAHPSTERIERYSGDEIGELARTCDAMVDSVRASVGSFETTRGQLNALVGEISHSSEALAGASQQMAATSQETGRAVGEITAAVSDVAQGAERQVRMVESTRTAVQEAARVAHTSEQTAAGTARAAEAARQTAREGVGAAAQATAAIEQVAAVSEQVTAAISDLSERSGHIGGIVDTIAGIAEQTNLLALNAAIEAARAGEQGRGFAVVADEVRKLAEESRSAAAQIAALIGEIQDETDRVVEVVASGARCTSEGVETVRVTSQAFEEIDGAIEDMTGRVSEIASAVQQIAAEAQRAEGDIAEVAAVAEQSSASAEQVSASTQETSATTEQVAASANELASTADQLQRLVARFTVAA
jgi:methyl-accepting chemotaxis protein